MVVLAIIVVMLFTLSAVWWIVSAITYWYALKEGDTFRTRATWQMRNAHFIGSGALEEWVHNRSGLVVWVFLDQQQQKTTRTVVAVRG